MKVDKFLKPIHADRDDVVTLTEWWEPRERRGSRPFVDSFNLLVIPFLSGSAGPLQRRFLTVINRDSFHPRAQFSEGQLSMKERNGTATSAAGRRTDHPCQRAFSSISMARTCRGLEVCLLKNS